jgi:hypothetical protein
MAYTSGFFDAIDTGGGEYDRVYDAATFAHYFSLFIGNGVFPNPSTGMQVTAMASPTTKVTVNPGNGWINGYYITIPTDEAEVLTIPTANASLARIDSVIMGLNYTDREVQIYVRSGAASSNPSAVTLQRDTDLYELELAQIQVAAGAASITQSMITDMRMNTSRCGIVSGIVNQIDTTNLFAQYDATFQSLFAQYKSTFQDSLDQYDDTFQTWFNAIKAQFTDDAVGSLQTQITALNTKVDNIDTTQSKVIDVIPFQMYQLNYTGATQTVTLNGVNTDKMTISGTTSAKDVGSYTATATLNTGYRWGDGTTDVKTIVWSISKGIVSVPSQKAALTYTGSSQSPSWNNYDSNQLTIGGTTSATDAGTYTATFTPNPNYQWEDGSTSAKTVSWTIGKAAGSLSLDKSSVTLSDAMTGTVTATRAGDGTISATSSSTSVATVSVSGNTITVTGKAAGTATITVSVAAGTNHAAPSSQTFTVTVSLLTAKTTATSGVTYTSGISGITQAKLSSYAKAISNNSAITNATTAVYIDDGDSHYKISVGDTVSITVSSASYSFRIVGFNHDTLADSTAYGSTTATGNAGISFQMVNCLATTYSMNSSNTNSGGWGSCALRTTLQSTIKNTIASAWTGIMKAVSKKTSAGSQSTTINTTSDDLFLLSEVEVFGSTTYSVSGEGERYAYYKAGNSKVKNVNGSAVSWWERSPRSFSSANCCGVSDNGDADSLSASRSLGVAFGFCV